MSDEILVNVMQLQLGDVGIHFSAEREELRAAIGHIYQPFVVGEGAAMSAADADTMNATGSAKTARRCRTTDGAGWRATVNRETYEAENFDLAVRTVEDAIADRLLESVADHLLVHAAAVVEDQTAVVFVGQSGSGKTTSVLELVRRGTRYRYLTDEFTAISPCASYIRPFPRSATRKFESRTPDGENFVIDGPHGFRTHWLPKHRCDLQPVPIKQFQIIFPTHDPTRAPAARHIGSAELCSRLMPSIFDFEHRERERWTAIANLATRSVACELNYRDAATDLDLALNLLAAQ